MARWSLGLRVDVIQKLVYLAEEVGDCPTVTARVQITEAYQRPGPKQAHVRHSLGVLVLDYLIT